MAENENSGNAQDDVVVGEVLPETEPKAEREHHEEKKKISKTDSSSFRRDLAFSQKKMAELDIAISEIQETVQKIDVKSLDELKQRVDDIEDLTMVENAGILELKKMLEGIQPKAEEVKIPPELQEKINSLEQKILTIPDMTEFESRIKESLTAEIPTGVDEKINSLEQKILTIPDMTEFESRIKESLTAEMPGIKELESSLQSSKEEFQNKLNELNAAITNMQSRLAEGIDIEQLKNDVKSYILPLIPEFPNFDSFKRRLEDSISTIKFDIENYKREVERVKQEVGEKANSQMQTKLLKELENVRNDSLVNTSKLDAIDSFAKELAKEINGIRPLINRVNNKVESFEGLGDVEKTIDEKLSEFRSVLAAAETIKQGNEPFKELDQVLSRFRDVENKLAEMKTFIDEFDKSKEDILTLKWKTDYKKLVDDMDKRFENLKREVEGRFSEDRNAEFEEKLEGVEKNIEGMHEIASSFDRKIGSNENIIKSLENDLSVLQGSVMALENRTSKSTISSMNQIAEKVDSLESDIGDKASEQEGRMAQIIDRINDLEGRVSTSSTSLMDELINRIVFLETRLTALESTLSEEKSQPIILE
ncbi:MAG: hypothetical protein HYW23_04505 [Candidatus Aenigmarchaeota archaeon]|nr:hypothetical protein [Candidatus Aenigmarchaeota archaeon]